MENCIFCKIIKGEIPAEKIFENEEILAFLDINPVNPGHSLVIPKKHFENLVETPPEIACHMIKAAQKIGAVLNHSIEADGFNLSLNNGRSAGQVVSHVHLHVMPRFEGDGLELWPGKPVSNEDRTEIASAIKQSIDT